MVASLAGLLLSSAGAIGSGIISAQRANNATDINNQAYNQRRNWYAQAKAGDYINRTDTQSALAKQRDLLNEQYRNARATNIVSGGSDASLAMQKSIANQSLAQTTSTIASGASSYKDSIDRAQLADSANNANMNAQILDAQAQRISQSGNVLQQAGAGLIANDDNPWGWLVRKQG